MKRFLFSVLILVCSAPAMAQTVDEVVDKYVEAVGGKEKLKKSADHLYGDCFGNAEWQ